MSKRSPGPIRVIVDTVTKMSRASGLTFEQTADFIDMLAALQHEHLPKPSTEDDTAPVSKTVQ